MEEEKKTQKKIYFKTKLHSKNEELFLKVLRKNKIDYLKENDAIKTSKPNSLWKKEEDGYYTLEIEKKYEDFFLKIIRETIKEAIIKNFKKANMIFEINEKEEEVLIIGRRF